MRICQCSHRAIMSDPFLRSQWLETQSWLLQPVGMTCSLKAGAVSHCFSFLFGRTWHHEKHGLTASLVELFREWQNMQQPHKIFRILGFFSRHPAMLSEVTVLLAHSLLRRACTSMMAKRISMHVLMFLVLVGALYLGQVTEAATVAFFGECIWVDRGQVSGGGWEGTGEKFGWHLQPCYPPVYRRWTSKFWNSHSDRGPETQRCRLVEKWKHCPYRWPNSKGRYLHGEWIFSHRWSLTCWQERGWEASLRHCGSSWGGWDGVYRPCGWILSGETPGRSGRCQELTFRDGRAGESICRDLHSHCGAVVGASGSLELQLDKGTHSDRTA